MVPLVAKAGFSWMATDEQILARTLGTSFTRDDYGHSEHPQRLYRPYAVKAGGAQVGCVFRDHVLSDRDRVRLRRMGRRGGRGRFRARLVEAGRRFTAAGGGEALLPVILDGENAWEHFEGGGRPFLRALYGRLSAHPELRTVTMADGCAGPRRRSTASFRARGSTPTSTSGSVTGTTSGPGTSSPMPGARSMPRAGSTPIRSNRPAKKCWSRKAAIGSGGTETIIPRTTTRSSTTSSGVTCGTSTGCSASRCPRASSTATSRPPSRPPRRHCPPPGCRRPSTARRRAISNGSERGFSKATACRARCTDLTPRTGCWPAFTSGST